MREIKIKLWNKRIQKMMNPCDTIFIATSGEIYLDGLNVTEYYDKLQFIGLLDKNDKEVYECDTIDVCVFFVSPSNPDNDNHFRGYLKFEYGCWMMNIFKYMHESTKGNFVSLEECNFPFDADSIENGICKIPLMDLLSMSGNLGECNEENIEVIGNIYENPELLNPTNDESK